MSYDRAIINDKQHSVSWLLTHEAKVNAKDSMGWTPLHYAAHSSKTDVTRALLERGASPSLKNNKGKLPVDIAKSRVIAKLLKEAKDKEKGPSSRLSWFGFKVRVRWCMCGGACACACACVCVYAH